MINYLMYAFVVIAAFIVAVFGIQKVNSIPTGKEIETLKEWLKYAVTAAEQALGSGTGQLKLRYVYDLFVDKFPWLAKAISFSRFSEYVDEALVWMRGQLESNTAIAEIVNGEDE